MDATPVQHSDSPTARIDQSTLPPPDAIGWSFAADVIKCSRQLIFFLRETVTSYSSSLLLEDERHQTLRNAIVKLCLEMRPMDGPPAVIRTDPAPGFKALVNDPLLEKHRITIELGQAKNPNKNPIAERAVQELETELLRQEPLGGAVSPLTLAVATSALNSRIRSRGLSSREMWTQRDQFSNKQLPLADDHLITLQHKQRLSNHPHSERSKAPVQQRRPTPQIDVGDLVYLHSDLNKSRARDRYLVVAIEPPFCDIKKFIGSQLRSSSYHVKLSECFKVPSDLADPYVFPTHVAVTTQTMKTNVVPHRALHPLCLTSLMSSLLQRISYLTALTVLHNKPVPFLLTIPWLTQLHSRHALMTPH